MSLSTHVLDASRGRPAAGMRVRLQRLDGKEWTPVGEEVTNEDGRVPEFVSEGPPAGTYRLVFDSGAYFGDQPTFYPEVGVTFWIADPAEHYHVPLLFSPFAYSTYRGS